MNIKLLVPDIENLISLCEETGDLNDSEKRTLLKLRQIRLLQQAKAGQRKSEETTTNGQLNQTR